MTRRRVVLVPFPFDDLSIARVRHSSIIIEEA